MYLLVVCCGVIVLLTDIGVVAFPQDYVYNYYERNSSYSHSYGSVNPILPPPLGGKKWILLTQAPLLVEPRVIFFGLNNSTLVSAASLSENVVVVQNLDEVTLRIPVNGKLYAMLVETHKYKHYQYCSSVVVQPRKDTFNNETIILDFGTECGVKLTPIVERYAVGNTIDMRCFNKHIGPTLPGEYLKYYWTHANYTMNGFLQKANGSSLTTKLHLKIEPLDHFTDYECFARITSIGQDVSFGKHHIVIEGINVSDADQIKPYILRYTLGARYSLCDLKSNTVATEKLVINRKTGTYRGLADSRSLQSFSSAQNNTEYVCISYYHPKGTGFSRSVKYVKVINVEDSMSLTQLRNRNQSIEDRTYRTLGYADGNIFRMNGSLYGDNMNVPKINSTRVSKKYIEPLSLVMDILYLFGACIGLLIAYIIQKKRTNRNSDQSAIISYSAQDTRALPQCPEPRHYETPQQESPYVYDYVYQHWNTQDEDPHIYHYARPTNEVNSRYLPMSKNGPMTKNLPPQNIPISNIPSTSSNNNVSNVAPTYTPMSNGPPKYIPMSSFTMSKK